MAKRATKSKTTARSTAPVMEVEDGTPSAARDRRKGLVERQLLEHATTIFAQKGYAGTSLSDIANSLGLTRGAIYYYFKNKEAVLEAIIQDLTINPVRDIEKWRSEAKGSASERLKSFIRMRILYVIRRGVRMRILELTESSLPADLLKRHNAAKRQILNEYSDLIREGVKKGEFRPVDHRVAAFGLIGMVNWTAWWFIPDRGKTAEQIADQLSEMAIRSLLEEEYRRRELKDPSAAIDVIKDDLNYLSRLLQNTSMHRLPKT